MKAKYLILFAVLLRLTGQAQVNYSISGNAAYASGNLSTSGYVTIGSSYNGFPVVGIANNAFDNCTNMTGVSIPSSVTNIGSFAFSFCTGLKDVPLPGGLRSIGDYAFWGCSGLTTVTIPISVSHIGTWAFYECTNLLKVDLNGDGAATTSGADIGQQAFAYCLNLTNATINYNVTDLNYGVFQGCSRLGSFVVLDAVTNIGNDVFYQCSNLTNVVLGKKISRLGNDLFYASGLRSMLIPSGINSIGSEAFRGCAHLTNLTFWGNAPDLENDAFANVAGNAKVYHLYNTTGWGATYGGLPTEVWGAGNDLFANRIFLSGTNVSTTGSTAGATIETGESPGYTDDPSIWWSWSTPIDGATVISVDRVESRLGSAASVQIFEGSDLALLKPVAWTSPWGPSVGNVYLFQAKANTPYQISVYNYGAETPDLNIETLNLNINLQAAPKIISQVGDGELSFYESIAYASFSVDVAGAQPMGIQWLGSDNLPVNGEVITLPPGTAAALSYDEVSQLSLQPASARDLTVRAWITNSYGEVSSSNISLDLPIPGLRLAKADFWPGIPTTITIAARPQSGTTSYAVQQQLPDAVIATLPVYDSTGAVVGYQDVSTNVDWRVSNISDGGYYDPIGRQVKFGPYFDILPRNLTFTIVPPLASSNAISFITGTGALMSEDGVNETIDGISEIQISNQHPADNNPVDWRITIQELSAYSRAWRKSLLWAVPPNPPPIDYMTRAGLLWKGGELYTNTLPGTAPLWWINVPPIQNNQVLKAATFPASKFVSAVESDEGFLAKPHDVNGAPEVVRQAALRYSPGIAFGVQLNVSPTADTVAYAVEEQIPTNCTVSDINAGGVIDSFNNKIKWGPFFSTQTNVLSYNLTPASSLMTPIVFNGVASFDGSTTLMSGRQFVIKQGTSAGPLSLLPPVTGLGKAPSLGVTAPIGTTVILEATTNLLDWSSVVTQTVDSSPLFLGDKSTNIPVRFYRLRVP